MNFESIHIVINEPTGDDGIGGFEWRVDREEANRAFRSVRGLDSATYLYNDVTVPEELRSDADAVTEWVDSIYWGYGHTPDEMTVRFGTAPSRVHLA